MVDRSKYKPVNGKTDRNWPEKGHNLTVGDSVEGVYVSKAENVGANASNVYILETPDGELVGVWGSTVLDANFEKIAIGSEVAIEYLGEQRPKSGGKPYKNFFIGVADQAHVVEKVDNKTDDIPF